ncbi:MAG: hypothetical protein ACK5XL_01850, partial [Cyclobacteriaceae bacterium]
MKTKNAFLFVGILAAVTLVIASCGGGEKAAREKARLDSIRVADSIAVEQRKADSIAALPKPIAVFVMNTPNLATLKAALDAGELTSVFEGTDTYTL